jgi:TPR repeat protein
MGKRNRWPRWVMALPVVAAIATSADAAMAPLDYVERLLAQGNYTAALLILVPRAEARQPEAEYRLSLLYGSGIGVPQDYPLQAMWCLDAAEQDYPPAQLSMARLYHWGFGVLPDRIASYVWAVLAASRMPPGPRREEAIRYREFTKNYLALWEIDQGQQLAAAWRPHTPVSDGGPMPLTLPAAEQKSAGQSVSSGNGITR